MSSHSYLYSTAARPPPLTEPWMKCC